MNKKHSEASPPRHVHFPQALTPENNSNIYTPRYILPYIKLLKASLSSRAHRHTTRDIIQIDFSKSHYTYTHLYCTHRRVSLPHVSHSAYVSFYALQQLAFR